MGSVAMVSMLILKAVGGSLTNLNITRITFNNFYGNPTNYNLGGNGVFANLNAVNSALTDLGLKKIFLKTSAM